MYVVPWVWLLLLLFCRVDVRFIWSQQWSSVWQMEEEWRSCQEYPQRSAAKTCCFLCVFYTFLHDCVGQSMIQYLMVSHQVRHAGMQLVTLRVWTGYCMCLSLVTLRVWTGYCLCSSLAVKSADEQCSARQWTDKRAVPLGPASLWHRSSHACNTTQWPVEFCAICEWHSSWRNVWGDRRWVYCISLVIANLWLWNWKKTLNRCEYSGEDIVFCGVCTYTHMHTIFLWNSGQLGLIHCLIHVGISEPLITRTCSIKSWRFSSSF